MKAILTAESVYKNTLKIGTELPDSLSVSRLLSDREIDEKEERQKNYLNGIRRISWREFFLIKSPLKGQRKWFS